MSREQGGRNSALARTNRAVGWVTTCVVALAAVLLAGVGAVALLGQAGSAATWSRWSSVGQAFGVLSSVFSGMAVAALVVTFWIQFREIRKERAEFALQHESLIRAQAALDRSAAAELRGLHVDLVKLAIHDEHLAELWPSFGPGISDLRNRQYLYANLMLQHTRLQHRLGEITDAELPRSIRYLFANPLMREYWKDTAGSRRDILLPGSPEGSFNSLADSILREYENVLHCTNNRRQEPRVAADKRVSDAREGEPEPPVRAA